MLKFIMETVEEYIAPGIAYISEYFKMVYFIYIFTSIYVVLNYWNVQSSTMII